MSNLDDPASWLAKARSDLLCIDNNLASARVPWDAVCYHAQQAAEKSLKAVLASRGELIPRTHDLLALIDACIRTEHCLDSLRTDAYLLNPFSVAARYPGLAPDPDEDISRRAAAAAHRIVNAIAATLRI